jgi:uridine kinase
MSGANGTKTPVLVGIGGCSGSGKTTLAAALASRLGATHFHLDSYYRDLGHLALSERMQQNFDDPELIEVPLLTAHLEALARGERIERPIYDFATHTRVAGQTESVEAGRFLLVDGLFALYFPTLRPMYDLRIYVDAPDEICKQRRLRRDMEERGRTAASVLRQYEATVRPAGLKLVRPSGADADLVIDGTGAMDRNVERVVAELRRRGLYPEVAN